MSREIKIGLLTIIALIGAVWGYKFLKGQNLLSRSNVFYVVYKDVDNLPVSSPVLVNGLQVGVVQDLHLYEKDPDKVVVVLDVDRSIRVPRDSRAIIQTTSFLGNKAINLAFGSLCTDNCAVSGDTLSGEYAGLLESMVPRETLESYFILIRENIGGVVDSIVTRLENEDLGQGQVIDDVRAIIHNMKELTGNLNHLIHSSSRSLVNISKNLDSLTYGLKDNTDDINRMVNNLTEISEQLASINYEELSDKAASSIDTLNATLNNLSHTSSELDKLMTKINSGEGTIGKMMNDEALYENLEMTTKNLELLLQDFRLNPKRYVNVSVFGKRQKAYEVPEDDPAFEQDSTQRD